MAVSNGGRDLLGLPSLSFAGIESEPDAPFTLIRVNASRPPVECRHCHENAFVGHGTTEQELADVPMHGKPAKLVLTRRRYLCVKCGKTFHESLDDIHDDRLATKRLVEFVEKNALRLTFEEVARQTGIDPRTVRNIVDDYIDVLVKQHTPVTPEVLGIDEVKIGKTYLGVITNVKANTFVELLPGRTKKHLDAHFVAMPDKHKVEVVVTDLWNAYRQMAATYFPHAAVVADKFHVMRMAVEAVETLRKHIRQTELRGKAKTAERLSLKDERHLLLKRETYLTRRELAVLDDLRTKYPLLGIAQAAKEGFFDIYDAPDRKTAEAMFEAWKGTLDPRVANWFKRLAYDVDNWHQHVFKVFDYPFTNGYTESLNRFIKDANRIARGQSFPILRARLLYHNLAKVEERVVVRKRVKTQVPPAGPAGASEGFGAPPVIKTNRPPTRQRYDEVVEVRWLGAHIPTLCRLIEEGEFD